MPARFAARGLRRAELVTSDPVVSARFCRKVLGWHPVDAERGVDCWVGARRCAVIRRNRAAEPTGWLPVFAGVAHDSAITGPDCARALMTRGRAQHGPWAPGPRPGEPCWADLFASEPANADAFWTDTLNWTARAEPPEVVYATDDRAVAGRVPARGIAGRWGWLCYFAVGDVDATVRRVSEWDGSVVAEETHPLLGRTAVLADPLGAVLGLARATGRWGA